MTGVAFNQPPAQLIPDISASIAKAVAALPQGKSGALVGVATTSGVNAAVVAKINDTWTVQAYVGKTWSGPVTGGAQILATW
jgi:hypothetical protein